MRSIAACAAALLLSAPALAAPPPRPNAFNAQLRALSPADRAGALRRAVTLANQRCGRLAQSVDRGQYGNLGFWQVRCVPGGDYAVFTGPDGSVQVRGCADMAALKLPACVAMKPEPAPPPAPRRR
ncbi:hypothetical protein [Sphingomonas morindae]|uniref:Uncharacterized protein n=1 Tax=Sphingomonas morindae TaxID=1541170 RepID=A0ABY4XBY5_9SPHN|nr:hypothetical protein [Sphingomonas morindae]USI74408.1 hypothetical protein LHA26_08145 [Sphingomonas morindae]